MPGKIRISGGGVDLAARADDEHQIDVLGAAEVFVYIAHGVVGEGLAEPDDAGAEEVGFALGAAGEVVEGDRGEGHVGVGDVGAADEGVGVGGAGAVVGVVGAGFQGGFEVVLCLGDGEGGHDGVGEVVGAVVAAAGAVVPALDVEEVAVEEFELGRRVVGAWAEAVDVLREGDELGVAASEFGEGEVRAVWFGVERHVSAVAVELPDEGWVGLEGFGCG